MRHRIYRSVYCLYYTSHDNLVDIDISGDEPAFFSQWADTPKQSLGLYLSDGHRNPRRLRPLQRAEQFAVPVINGSHFHTREIP